MMDRPCNRCGECCLQFGAGIVADPEDVVRWINERRWDILEHLDPIHELDSEVDVTPTETGRCPFLKKDRGEPTYKCRIHDSKPRMCRNYEPWVEGAVCKEI